MFNERPQTPTRKSGVATIQAGEAQVAIAFDAPLEGKYEVVAVAAPARAVIVEGTKANGFTIRINDKLEQAEPIRISWAAGVGLPKTSAADFKGALDKQNQD